MDKQRELLIDFAEWLSDGRELDVMSADEAVDAFYASRNGETSD